MSAAFDHIVINANGHLLTIVHELNGPVSVTNDIENVIERVARVEGVAALYYPVVYRDSSGVWDAFEPLKGKFEILNERSAEGAIHAWLNLQNS